MKIHLLQYIDLQEDLFTRCIVYQISHCIQAVTLVSSNNAFTKGLRKLVGNSASTCLLEYLFSRNKCSHIRVNNGTIF